MGIVEGKRAVFGGEFGASHCNQWGHSFVVMREWRTLPKLLWRGLVYVLTKKKVYFIRLCGNGSAYDEMKLREGW